MEFYAAVFGGELAVNTWAEFGRTGTPDADRTGHAVPRTDVGYTIMAGDVTGDVRFQMCVDAFGVPWMVNISNP